MHWDVGVSRAYIASLFLGSEAPQNPWFLLHFFFVQLLLIYLPFGKLLHIPGVFYSKALLAKDY
jgi:nitrate reductase gamma subunit